mmetsp:Transcript_32422/g.52496  ORF Transcript_32422/g.52496 Transcript_32422/m.52496 type:complete len:229 (+) Transcript_32422:830-1516(+)
MSDNSRQSAMEPAAPACFAHRDTSSSVPTSSPSSLCFCSARADTARSFSRKTLESCSCASLAFAMYLSLSPLMLVRLFSKFSTCLDRFSAVWRALTSAASCSLVRASNWAFVLDWLASASCSFSSVSFSVEARRSDICFTSWYSLSCACLAALSSSSSCRNRTCRSSKMSLSKLCKIIRSGYASIRDRGFIPISHAVNIFISFLSIGVDAANFPSNSVRGLPAAKKSE